MNDGENKNSPFPREDAIGIKWETSTYKSMRKNGAALYWMGWKLNQALDVPIGLVNASWGATKIDGWIDQAWAKDHGTGHAKGVAGFWYNRWTDFMKAGGPEVYEKKIFEWNKRFDPASNFVNRSTTRISSRTRAGRSLRSTDAASSAILSPRASPARSGCARHSSLRKPTSRRTGPLATVSRTGRT